MSAPETWENLHCPFCKRPTYIPIVKRLGPGSYSRKRPKGTPENAIQAKNVTGICNRDYDVHVTKRKPDVTVREPLKHRVNIEGMRDQLADYIRDRRRRGIPAEGLNPLEWAAGRKQ